MNNVIKSWRTTLAGILQFLALAFTEVGFLFDGIDATNPNWGLVVASLITLIGLLTARDNNVSSETAGAS